MSPAIALKLRRVLAFVWPGAGHGAEGGMKEEGRGCLGQHFQPCLGLKAKTELPFLAFDSN